MLAFREGVKKDVEGVTGLFYDDHSQYFWGVYLRGGNEVWKILYFFPTTSLYLVTFDCLHNFHRFLQFLVKNEPNRVINSLLFCPDFSNGRFVFLKSSCNLSSS